MINGIGVWPDTNDFYRFMNWGLVVGIGIFGLIVVMAWILALILRLPNVIGNRKEDR